MSFRVLVDRELPAVDVLFDARRLSGVLGGPLRVDHLRHKPGLSVIARTHDQDARVGWIASYHPREAVKLEKTVRRAERLGAKLSRVLIDDSTAHELVMGAIELDRRLYEPLSVLGYRSDWGGPEPVRVLNYNPLRRVVLALGEGDERVVCKVGVPSGADAALLRRLAADGVPVLEQVSPAGLPDSNMLRYFPWFGAYDLSTGRGGGTGQEHLDVRCGYEAGEALARLHAVHPPATLVARIDSVGAIVQGAVQETARRIPALASRLLHRVAGFLGEEPVGRCRCVLLHGDFSADQVLVDQHEVRLIDFDRCGLGPAESDLGSFAADELIRGLPGSGSVPVLDLPVTAALLAGYTDGHGSFSERRVRDWVALHVLRRLNEPFRACSPHWRESTAERMKLIEQLLV